MSYHAKFLQLPGREGVQVSGLSLGEFYNISYQVTIDLIQFLQEEHQGRKGFGILDWVLSVVPITPELKFC